MWSSSSSSGSYNVSLLGPIAPFQPILRISLSDGTLSYAFPYRMVPIQKLSRSSLHLFAAPPPPRDRLHSQGLKVAIRVVHPSPWILTKCSAHNHFYLLTWCIKSFTIVLSLSLSNRCRSFCLDRFSLSISISLDADFIALFVRLNVCF